MKLARLILALAMATPLFSQATEPPDPRFEEIQARHKRGEKISPEDQDYASSVIERRNQAQAALRYTDWAKEHPARDSTGLIPLTDLGAGKYKGEQGGLYPNGSNTLPAAHLAAGIAIAKKIQPLDRAGRPAPDGKIVLMGVGMSNTTQESRSFIFLAKAHASEINPSVLIVDGAQGAQTAALIARPEARYWSTPMARLEEAGATAAQVQAVWLKEADAMPKEAFPIEVKKMQAELLSIVHILHDKFPNLRVIYCSSRIYAGYAAGPLNPEPHAYESGFAFKWLIADQIAGNPELNYDPAKGAVRAPWLAWGPYLWADGIKGRKDGWIWKREDLGPDGTHPSMKGREKVAQLLLSFFEKDATAGAWFARR